MAKQAKVLATWPDDLGSLPPPVACSGPGPVLTPGVAHTGPAQLRGSSLARRRPREQLKPMRPVRPAAGAEETELPAPAEERRINAVQESIPAVRALWGACLVLQNPEP